MTRLPNLNPRQIITALTRGGFIYRRQKGSHVLFWNESKGCGTTVSIHSGDVARHILKKIIKQAGFTEEEFSKLI